MLTIAIILLAWLCPVIILILLFKLYNKTESLSNQISIEDGIFKASMIPVLNVLLLIYCFIYVLFKMFKINSNSINKFINYGYVKQEK